MNSSMTPVSKNKDDCKQNSMPIEKNVNMKGFQWEGNAKTLYLSIAPDPYPDDCKRNSMEIEKNVNMKGFQWVRNAKTLYLGIAPDPYCDQRPHPSILTAAIIDEIASTCPHLKKLVINGGYVNQDQVLVTDECISNFKKFKELNFLNISCNNITGSTLKDLPQTLEELHLDDCHKITDASIAQLANLKLKKLAIIGCPQLSDATFDKLPNNTAFLFRFSSVSEYDHLHERNWVFTGTMPNNWTSVE